MLTATGIQKNYGILNVLKGVNISLMPGEVVTLVGASGAGKSTLLQILGTLDKADSGTVIFENRDVTAMGEHEKALFRNTTLGFVFQFHHLLPEFTAAENVAIPAYIKGTPRSEADKRALELLSFMNLRERAHHKPSQLSGGEQQRVAVARALINNPRLILADEPTGNLDSVNSENLFRLFMQLASEFKVGVLVTTHNEALARSANRQLRMKDGLILPENANG